MLMPIRFSEQGARGVTAVRFTIVYESYHRGTLLLSAESEKPTSMVTQTLVIEGERRHPLPDTVVAACGRVAILRKMYPNMPPDGKPSDVPARRRWPALPDAANRASVGVGRRQAGDGRSRRKSIGAAHCWAVVPAVQEGRRRIMKVLICDYPESMMPDHTLEVKTLREGLGDELDVVIHPYDEGERGQFLELLSDADALLTAFAPVDEEALDHAPNLKVIAINATGYDNVDLAAATRHGAGVCPIGEYCTWDVSESAIAYMFALNKHLKFYTRQIEVEHAWDFAAAPQYPRMQDQTLGIIGFGKIGRCTAGKASGLVKRVMAYDPYVGDEEFERLCVERVLDRDELFASADIIVNHMCLTDSSRFFFDASAFSRMQRSPILINLGRGLSVDEGALVRALDDRTVRAFGADVLYDETPDLANNPLVGRDNVIITPHSAFYSTASMRDVQVVPCQNIVHFLRGERDQLFKLVNDVPVGVAEPALV